MNRPAFEELVHKALRKLPRKFKEKLENISIHIEDWPSRETLEDMGIEDGTLYPKPLQTHKPSQTFKPFKPLGSKNL